MSVDGRLKVLSKQMQEMSVSNQELKAQNEHLRKQLGNSMKQKQKLQEPSVRIGRIMDMKRKLAMRYLSVKRMYHSKGQEEELDLLSTLMNSRLKFLSLRVS